jgi:hypothetical protein
MSGMRKEISPPKGRYLFDGGLNSKFERTIIGDNESPDCLNVVFSNGAVETREGVSKLNTTTVGAYQCDGLYVRHGNTGSQTMVAFIGGSAYSLATTTFVTISSAQSVFTAGVRVGCAEYQQHLFIGNGGVIPYKLNGTDFTRHGVYPPTTTSTVASQAAGTLTGEYRYKVTYVNSQLVESDIGPVTATFTAAAATLRLSAIPVAPQSFGISARKVYRNSTAATSTYKLLTTLNDNTTTTFDDNLADATLGANAPTDHGVPPKYSWCLYHRDRLFCDDPANPNFVWYSDLEEPYTFGAANFRLFGDNAQNVLRAGAVMGEHVVLFGDRSIDMIYMADTDDANWQSIRVKSMYGCKSPFGIVPYENGLLFPAIYNGNFVGFAHLIGDALVPSATLLTVANAGSDLLSNKVEPDMLNVLDSAVAEISGIVSKNIAYFSVPYGGTATENNRIYIFDFSITDLSKKTPYSWAPWSGLYAAQFTDYNGTVYYGDGRATGYFYRMNNGLSRDDTAAIDSYYWTKEFGGNPGDFNFHKDFRYANALIELPGAYRMNVTTRVDSDLGSGNTQAISVDPGGSIWGTANFGIDSWGGGNGQKEVRIDLGTSAGKRIQFKFDNQNTINQRFKVHGLNFLSNVKGFR